MRRAGASGARRVCPLVVVLNKRALWFLSDVFVRFVAEDVAIESFLLQIPVVAIVQRASAMETPKTAQGIGPFSEHHAVDCSRKRKRRTVQSRPRSLAWKKPGRLRLRKEVSGRQTRKPHFGSYTYRCRNRSASNSVISAKEFVIMPIFFMLPFIILQGMLEVGLDEARARAKSDTNRR